MAYSRRRSYFSLVCSVVFLVSAAHLVNAQDLKPEDIYQKVAPSVATLTVDKTDGSQALGCAFICLKDGLAVTAWHVVKNAAHVTAKFSDGQEFEVSGLVDKDYKRDVAIVKIKVFGRPVLATVPTDPPVGSKSYAIGAPEGLEFSISEGLVSQIQTTDGIKCYQFSCAISPGSSGGPLVDAKGDVIGVVDAFLRVGQNLNFAVPISYVLGLDTTLPTQPWAEVKTDLPDAGSASTDPTVVDSILGNSVVSALDADVAIQGTLALMRKPAFTERRAVFVWEQNRKTWQLYTPVYLYECQKDLASKTHGLSGLALDGARATLRDSLLKVMASYSECVQGLMDTIKIVQDRDGWTPEAHETAARAVAVLPKDNDLSGLWDKTTLLEVARSKDFCSPIPEDTQVALGIMEKADWFRLSVGSFCRNPLTFIVVIDGGLAKKMGFKSGDVLLRFAGHTLNTLTELKDLIRANRGKDVEAVVRRDGKEVKLKVAVPKELPSR